MAAWLQFEVHDWFSHGKNQEEDPWQIEIAEDDPWHEHPMPIPRTRKDTSYDPASGHPPTFTTDDSHWWDGSQIYGSNPDFAAKLRSGEMSKIRIDEDGLLPADLEKYVDLTDVGGNFWVGLALLHTLFSLEHNAVCDMLARVNPACRTMRSTTEHGPYQRRADGKDPHRRVDSVGDRPPPPP